MSNYSIMIESLSNMFNYFKIIINDCKITTNIDLLENIKDIPLAVELYENIKNGAIPELINMKYGCATINVNSEDWDDINNYDISLNHINDYKILSHNDKLLIYYISSALIENNDTWVQYLKKYISTNNFSLICLKLLLFNKCLNKLYEITEEKFELKFHLSRGENYELKFNLPKGENYDNVIFKFSLNSSVSKNIMNEFLLDLLQIKDNKISPQVKLVSNYISNLISNPILGIDNNGIISGNSISNVNLSIGDKVKINGLFYTVEDEVYAGNALFGTQLTPVTGYPICATEFIAQSAFKIIKK